MCEWKKDDQSKRKKERKGTCTICHSSCETISFRSGRICEHCLQYVITECKIKAGPQT